MNFEKKNLNTFLFIFFILTTFSFGAIITYLHYQKIDFSALELHVDRKPSQVLDDEGNELFKFYSDRKEPIFLSQVPLVMINAFIAAEDWNFFNHYGISLKGIIRSIFINLYNRKKVQGASTITQQLIKLLYLDGRKTFIRKIKEQFYAILLEWQCTKQQILTSYLNNIYFGNGIYGISAATERLLNTSLDKVSIAQAALLAGIVRCPKLYNPTFNPEKALKRRNTVLGLMRNLFFISETDYRQALQEPLPALQLAENNKPFMYIKEMIRSQCEETLSKKVLYEGGLIIKTTLNKNIQLNAFKTFNEFCGQLTQEFSMPINGALLSVEVKTGAIKAIIGGTSLEYSQFNRAFQARRQLGSIFKPLIYAAALDQGFSFDQVMVDEPLDLKDNNKSWQPNNYNLLFNGPITLAYALSHSNNIVAIKTLLQVGFDPVIALAKKAHIAAPAQPYPSLALGCIDVTLKEAVGMFNIFPNHGNYVDPHLISWIKNKWGKKEWIKVCKPEEILSASIADQVTHVLKLGLQRLQRQLGYEILDFEAISKTGTTNKSRTCWFLGSTPELTTGILIGCDDNRSMGTNIYPSKTAFPMWRAFNREITCTIKKFTHDLSLEYVYIDERTGKRVKPSDPHAISLLV